MKQQCKKRLENNEDSLREFQGNMKHNNICECQKLEKQGIKNLFEKIMTINFPNLMRKKVMQVQETQRVPIKMNPQKPAPKHIIKMATFKDKESILKGALEK